MSIRRLMIFAKDTSTQRVFFPFCRLKGRRLKEHWTVTEVKPLYPGLIIKPLLRFITFLVIIPARRLAYLGTRKRKLHKKLAESEINDP